jgi:hypothetical protein
MDRAPFTTAEFAALRRVPPPLSAGQAAALRRAAELAVELNELVATVRGHLAELGAARPAVPPEVEPTVQPLFSDEGEASQLGKDELRDALGSAQDATPARERPRWADDLLGELDDPLGGSESRHDA